MDQRFPVLHPPRPLGQILRVQPTYLTPILGGRRPGKGALQVDGIETVAALDETYVSPFGPYVQVDGIETVAALDETYTSPFSGTVQLDGIQVVILLNET